MTSTLQKFGTLYHPQKALLIYQQRNNATGNKVYIESYDIANDGTPINAHPLSVKESNDLAKALHTTEGSRTSFLKPKGLLPKNVLYINTDKNSFALWHTPKQRVKLLFRKDLGIPSAEANIPAMIWKASKNGIAVYAVVSEEIILATELHHAPFFNIYPDGKVCMGNVQFSIPNDCGLEDFIRNWEQAFFNSYFSHLMQGHNPVKGNIVQLWKSLVNTNKKFPSKLLIPNKFTVKNLIP